MGLSRQEIADLNEALAELKVSRSAAPWAAVPALARLGAAGRRIEIDLGASRQIGAAVIVARPPAPRFDGLTPRQQQVLESIARGRSNKTIARELGIALSTVKDHVHAILGRTGARPRTELIAMAQR